MQLAELCSHVLLGGYWMTDRREIDSLSRADHVEEREKQVPEEEKVKKKRMKVQEEKRKEENKLEGQEK